MLILSVPGRLAVVGSDAGDRVLQQGQRLAHLLEETLAAFGQRQPAGAALEGTRPGGHQAADVLADGRRRQAETPSGRRGSCRRRRFARRMPDGAAAPWPIFFPDLTDSIVFRLVRGAGPDDTAPSTVIEPTAVFATTTLARLLAAAALGLADAASAPGRCRAATPRSTAWPALPRRRLRQPGGAPARASPRRATCGCRSMTQLAASRCTVIAPDLRGFGDSTASRAGYARRRWRGDVHATHALNLEHAEPGPHRRP